MPDFGIFRGFNDKLFGNKLYAGQLPTQLGTIGSIVIPIALLDLYPNAAAAYSLRKLRTLYTGSAIRVRRSSDNTEQDIGFNGINLDTSSLTSFCGSGNGFVTTWYDQSGNNLNFYNSTAVYQPQVYSNGTILKMQFVNNGLRTDNSTLFKNNKFTLIVWHRRNSLVNFGKVFCIDYRANGTWSPPYSSIELSTSQGSTRQIYNNIVVSGTGYAISSDSVINDNVWSNLAIRYKGTTLNSYVNGLKQTNQTSISGVIDYGTSNQMAVGFRSSFSPNDERFNGLLDFCILYPRDLTDSEIQSIYTLTSSNYI